MVSQFLLSLLGTLLLLLTSAFVGFAFAGLVATIAEKSPPWAGLFTLLFILALLLAAATLTVVELESLTCAVGGVLGTLGGLAFTKKWKK